MADQNKALWDESDSGFPSDFDARITAPGYMEDDKYGRVILDLELQSDDPDIGDDGVTVLKIGIGKVAIDDNPGWIINGMGAEIIHTKDKPDKLKRFDRNSTYTALLARVGELVPSMKRANPRDAAIWDGLWFHWEREEYDSWDGDKKQQVKRERLMPTKYLGNGNTPAGGGVSAGASEMGAAQVGTVVDEVLLRLAYSVVEASGGVDELYETALTNGLTPSMDDVKAAMAQVTGDAEG